MFYNIQLAKKRVLYKVEIQSDYREATYLVIEGCDELNDNFFIVRAIKEAIGPQMHISFKHIFREGNVVANVMAKFGLSMSQGILFFVDPSIRNRHGNEAQVQVFSDN
ncbi:hypothetical protein GmHk_04G010875 [Glycine max]|nr:hypothetical protein GmHk_04G010875 [Glycine max]